MTNMLESIAGFFSPVVDLFKFAFANPTNVSIFFAGLLAAVLFGFVIFLGMRRIIVRNHERKMQTEEEKRRPRDDTKLDEWMKTKQTGFFSYRKIDELMTSTGYKYKQRSKNKLVQLPSEFLVDCFVIAFIGGFICVGILWAFNNFTFAPSQALAFIPGFLIFLNFNKWSLTNSDKTDNKRMLPDINSMYETLKVSATAGIPIVDGLAECYRQVKHPRLKTAMSEVSNSIHAGRDIETAINNLRAQFTSPEIVQFCIVIKQALETGRQEEILSDLAANMREVQAEINHQIEESLNTKVQMIQMSLLFVLIFTMLYATMSTLTAQFGNL